MLKVSVDKYIRTLCQIIYEILPQKFYLTKQTALWICKQRDNRLAVNAAEHSVSKD